MICSKCNEKNEPGAKFCFVCGTRLEPVPVQPVQKAQQIKGREYYPSTAPIKIEEEAPRQDLSTRPLAQAALVPAGGGNEFKVPFKQEVLIGRADKARGIEPDIELTAIDANYVSSRKHAAIIYTDGSFFIKDLGSMNGTFVNDRKLEVNALRPIENGDKITIGKLIFNFKCNS